ncbi:methionine ABC transporter substrate-binding protein [Paenibacillus sp. CCS19]|uniref:MetQ/NlpA family ABC transporter substrate-binding protein n=1 Tax=Paenibacillus sp. CCS19 TaxID=3158387 RepID=UPI00256B057F|nr:MetQ/NlpA family ABC transporter substrate-binding protein [Paenibacillus cellulosilyticus]GMK39122.1 methionine ABC transporter substrate-binding protein [Paenibacillus cellulosilyticus]
MSKKRMVVLVAFLFVVSLIAVACGSDDKGSSDNSSKQASANQNPSDSASSSASEPVKEVTLKVGAAAVPHAEILEFIKPKLKAEGINLEIEVLDDEGQLNPALQEKQIDANYFQHVPYLDSVKDEKGYNFAVTAKVHVEPIGFYSSKLKSKDEIQEGATIGIPNNPSNEYRALVLLQQQGLIKLKDGLTTYEATPKDIIDNPKKLKFVEADSATLPRSLPDLDGAIINTNLVLEAKIDPQSALFREDANSPYANVIVVRSGDENRDEIKKLDDALTTPEVKKFIEEKYGVAVVPAF